MFSIFLGAETQRPVTRYLWLMMMLLLLCHCLLFMCFYLFAPLCNLKKCSRVDPEPD